jgi:hypothetical protein
MSTYSVCVAHGTSLTLRHKADRGDMAREVVDTVQWLMKACGGNVVATREASGMVSLCIGTQVQGRAEQ